MPEKERDWSKLPAELIHVIAKNLPDLLDFIRFRTVCKAWRSSAPLSERPHQFPWLLEVIKRTKYWRSLTEQQRYYSVSSGQTLMIPFQDGDPELKSWMEHALCTRYLNFRIDLAGVSFFNPLTKHRFFMPYECPVRICDPEIPYSLYYHGTGEGEWSFLDPQINKWIAHKGFFYLTDMLEKMYLTPESCPADVSNQLDEDELAHNGLFYSTDMLEKMYFTPESWPADVSNQLDKDELASRRRRSFLVESPAGILKVVLFHDWHLNSSVELSIFHIYWLDSATADGKPCWVRLADIDDQIIFLDFAGGFSLTARPSTGFRQGCIYFIDPQEEKPYMYDVLAGTVERIPCPFESCTWFLPGL
ncbi:F-box SKIP23-like protein (DUF295) [Rhynchospora pubera]|uniref:F-box SKIP23-like protein (DUF295) n=1 Tax=Rhynchospora pubera TaxID=906938 RepID=A0AAV8FT97_9POAL|nr:F-box SKIP23-like protein (DUF295) [Rhynchospora pubera]